jgi:hypothetical protein
MIPLLIRPLLTNQKTHQETPDSDKEDCDHDHDCPGRYLDIAPQVSPVSTVRCTQPVLILDIMGDQRVCMWKNYEARTHVSQDFGDQEPDDQLPSEQRLEEVGHIRRDLSE